MNSIVSVVILLFGAAFGTNFHFQNNLQQTLWFGSLGNDGKPAPEDGGFQVDPGQNVVISTDDSWAGRFWARTACAFDDGGNGACATGDCGNKFKCAGAGGNPPVTLGEITLNGDQGNDFYDVSLVDGYNVPMTFAPQNQQPDPNDHYRCGVAGCPVHLNPNCPDELRVVDSNGNTIACKSACLAFNTDEYCCRGDQHDTPDKCQSTDWPVNYPKYFKDACPDAYSYAYDDQKSTFTCQDTDYVITIG